MEGAMAQAWPLTDETLMAFADGELPLAQRIQVERAVAADPEAQARIAMFRETAALLRAAFVLDDDDHADAVLKMAAE
jgi:anti-sigma factor RsiW